MKKLETQRDCSLDDISHSGLIQKIDDQQIYVSIVSQSACAACHAKGVCNVSELSEEIVEVPKEAGIHYEVGQNVKVSMQKSLGTHAVFLGYILPFLILLATLIIALAITGREGLSGLLALAILIPYYLFLYTMRDRLKRTFTFRIDPF
ncbi:MAG: SoxR reducing system RseC family protein [Bacteroidetes bacterium]|nr:SoxR reducing system RseC family protein [Bacteroidota bacterium]